MPFNPINTELMLSGSHTRFKKREQPLLSEQENELKLTNKRILQEGIIILRKLRTQALAEQDPVVRQQFLVEAHHFSSQMAEVIINQALQDKPSAIDSAFLELLQKARETYGDKEADSGHATPPQFSVGNLFEAVDDMLVRIEEKAGTLNNPSHKLTETEIQYVLHEFLRGTNDLTINAISKLFQEHTKIGGILSGGSVYTEMVKKIVAMYADPSLTLDTFIIAVDKEQKRAVFESSEDDNSVQAVLVTDDMIDGGGTVLTALWNVGEQFLNATIYSGKGTDDPGGFEKRRVQKHMNYLFCLFQDFAELSEEGKTDEALAVFDRAEKYAKENSVILPAGYYIRKAKIEKSASELTMLQ